MEGIEGSHMEVLRFSLNEEDFKNANDYYHTFSAKNFKYEIPAKVKKSIKNGLNAYKVIGKGCSAQNIVFAKELCNSKNINEIKFSELKKLIKNCEEGTLALEVLGGEITKGWIDEIDKEIGEIVVMNGLSNNEISESIWSALDKYKYKDGEWEGRKYYIEEIYSDEKIAIIRDNETAEYYKMPYSIEDGKVNVNIEEKKLVHKTYEEVQKNFSADKCEAIVFAKKDYGTGDKITVDKSKEAMSEKAWGSVDKTALRKKVLEAKNYKSLVKDVYVIVEEGWEESPSSKLKYPIMEIIGNKAVYNRYALASALAYAQQHNEEAVIKKVKSLYKKLDIDNEEEGGEKKMEEEKIVENSLEAEKEEEVKVNAEEQEVEEKEEIKNSEQEEKDNKEEEKEEEIKNSDTCDDIGFANEEIKNSDTCDDIGFAKEEDKEEQEEKEEEAEAEEDVEKNALKEQLNALEVKCAEMEAELKKYKREEEERNMACELEKFAHCMSKAEVAELKNSIKDLSMETLKEKINGKIAEFALKMKEEAKEVKYSINPLFEIETMKFSKEEINSLDNIISNSHAKIAGK